MEEPDVGVVIPVYNPQAEHLLRCVASVLGQDGEWDCVIVDDGSTEEISPVNDPRIRVARQTNQGVSAARNTGVANVRGNYLAFIDQDDEWKPGKLERQLAFMRQHDLAACDTNFDIVRNTKIVATGYTQHHGKLENMLAGASTGLSTLMIRRDAFEQAGGFDTSLLKVQDWALLLNLLRAGHSLKRLQDNLCVYNLHSSNATRDFRATYRETINVLTHQSSLENTPAVRRAIRQGRAHARTLYTHQAIDAFRETGDRKALAWAARLRPHIVALAIARKATKLGYQTIHR